MSTDHETPEFWETSFTDKGEMWGFEPAQSALRTRDLFVQQGVKNVLVPGIGYGRNAQIFRDSGMSVTGIEIAQTAIDLARKHFGTDMIIHHGSVTDMPFDEQQYDGIFCYGLIHLLDSDERAKLIRDCYSQLAAGGLMVFTAITKEAKTYGQGELIGKDRYEQFGGARIFFYDRDAVEAEFEGADLFEIAEVEENFPFYMICCRKEMG